MREMVFEIARFHIVPLACKYGMILSTDNDLNITDPMLRGQNMWRNLSSRVTPVSIPVYRYINSLRVT